MLRTRIAALALATTAMAASGCGSSKSSTAGDTASQTQTQSPAQTQSIVQSSSAHPLSSAQFIAKANAICSRLNAQRATVKYRSREDFILKIPIVADYDRAAISELSKLTPPTSMSNDWKQVLEGDRTIAAYTAELVPYYEANNQTLVRQLLTKAVAIQGHIAVLATHDGFTVCGEE